MGSDDRCNLIVERCLTTSIRIEAERMKLIEAVALARHSERLSRLATPSASRD